MLGRFEFRLEHCGIESRESGLEGARGTSCVANRNGFRVAMPEDLMPRFAASLSMMFAEHPFLDRFARNGTSLLRESSTTDESSRRSTGSGTAATPAASTGPRLKQSQGLAGSSRFGAERQATRAATLATREKKVVHALSGGMRRRRVEENYARPIFKGYFRWQAWHNCEVDVDRRNERNGWCGR